MGKRRWITAEELMKQLHADPQWVAEQQQREARHATSTARLKADEAAILSDLTAAGIEVASVYDFLKIPSRPPGAVAVLVRHLDTPHLRNVREGVIRALGVPAARALAFEPLRAAYRVESDPTLRWVIANALAGMARFEEVRELPGIDEYAKLFR
jgi:hypothetical protein